MEMEFMEYLLVINRDRKLAVLMDGSGTWDKEYEKALQSANLIFGNHASIDRIERMRGDWSAPFRLRC
jgi:hypothetical protein